MRTLTDHLGRKVLLPFNPQRIISLCPSVTESLYDLGAGKNLVGRTRFCIHPKEIQSVKTVGGTKTIHYDKVDALNPDLIIAVKEENTAEMVEILEKKYPVFVLDIENVEEGIRMIETLGELTGHQISANEIQRAISEKWEQLKGCFPSLSVLYVIWQEPFMVAGNDTYINDLIQGLGWKNAANELPGRYPELSPEQITQLAPDKILLSSEPFPFKDKHIASFQRLAQGAEVKIVDGEAFSWYGTRLGKSIAYLHSLILQN